MNEIVHLPPMSARRETLVPARPKQEKIGATLAIPVHPHLQTVLDATPSAHLTFLVTATGKPYGGNALSEHFRNWCDAPRLPKRCKPHGPRKAADQARLARNALAKAVIR